MYPMYLHSCHNPSAPKSRQSTSSMPYSHMNASLWCPLYIRFNPLTLTISGFGELNTPAGLATIDRNLSLAIVLWIVTKSACLNLCIVFVVILRFMSQGEVSVTPQGKFEESISWRVVNTRESMALDEAAICSRVNFTILAR